MRTLGYKRRLDFLDNLYYSLSAEYNREYSYTNEQKSLIARVIDIIMDEYDETKEEANSYGEQTN